MNNPIHIFHKVSYLQYPLLLIALYYILKPYVVGFDKIWENYNVGFIFMGLGISFSTLQDTTKTQNNFSKRIWENPKKGKIALLLIASNIFLFIVMGFYGVYASESEILEQVSYGIIVLGIGLIGLLKSAIEMFENHRLDKNQGEIIRPTQ